MNLLSADDLKKIEPLLDGAIHFDVKQYSGRNAPREIIIENKNGKKIVANLDEPTLRWKEVKGLTSIEEHFARGCYGDTNWRGNCSGLLIKDVIEHYKPKFVIDPMAGSGTTGDVCRELGVPHLLLDLNPKYGGWDACHDDLPRSADLIFCHPPYFVYPGSSMPQYSGKMWGSAPNPNDGSRIQNEQQFTKWINYVSGNLYQGLRKGGHICFLVGDSRYKGRYYSMFKAMDFFGQIESIVIKRQFGCVSNSIQYSGKFIPIDHEYLIILRKDDEYVIHCMIVKQEDIDIMKSSKIKWRTLIQSTLEKMGGKATREEIYNILKGHPKAQNNNFVREKIRQIINSFPSEFVKVNSEVVALAA